MTADEGDRADQGPGVIAAWVDGKPLGQAGVDAQLRRMYAGPGGSRLSGPGTSEGRQLRRWLIQVLIVVTVLEHEARNRGLTASGRLPDADRAQVGGIAAAALARSPHAAAVFGAVTGDVTVAEADVDACRAANPDLAGEELRLVRHVRAGRAVNGGRPYAIRRHDLFGDLVFGVAVGDVVRVGRDSLELVGVTRHAAPDLVASLRRAARGRAFTRWLDVQLRDRVVLAPGSEHPADPSQPDHTHRH